MTDVTRWHTREDSGLRIDRQGRWWHDDAPVEHPNIIEAFNRGVRAMEDGRVQLHFGGDWCFVQVEDCAFTVLAVDASEDERLSVRLSDRTAEWLATDSLALDDEGVLVTRVKNGLARARFSREAQFQLAEHLEEREGGMVLKVGSRSWPTSLVLVLALLVMVLGSACGRTEPVRGLIEKWPAGFVTDAGVTTTTRDGGEIISGPCEGFAQTCPQGFHCESGDCVLNGGNADLQVTLQWQNTPRTPEDIDLHLVEPAGVGSCEIYYGSGGLFSCRPVGQLDLDANVSCFDTSTTAGLAFDTENIIYPAGSSAPKGHYIVRVDYFQECGGNIDVPFVVTVRKGTSLTRRTGVFHPGESDSGAEGSGITMIEFDMP